MNTDAAIAEIIRFIHLFLGVSVDGGDADLFADGGLDSIQLNAVLVFVDERFGVDIPGDQVSVEAIGTPRRLASTIARLSAT